MMMAFHYFCTILIPELSPLSDLYRPSLLYHIPLVVFFFLTHTYALTCSLHFPIILSTSPNSAPFLYHTSRPPTL